MDIKTAFIMLVFFAITLFAYYLGYRRGIKQKSTLAIDPLAEIRDKYNKYFNKKESPFRELDPYEDLRIDAPEPEKIVQTISGEV